MLINPSDFALAFMRVAMTRSNAHVSAITSLKSNRSDDGVVVGSDRSAPTKGSDCQIRRELTSNLASKPQKIFCHLLKCSQIGERKSKVFLGESTGNSFQM